MASELLLQTFAPIVIITCISPIIVYQKIYPAEKIYDLVHIFYKFTIPFSLLYNMGWNSSQWEDFLLLFSIIVTYLIGLIIVAILASVFAWIEKCQNKSDINYFKHLLPLACLVLSQQIQQLYASKQYDRKIIFLQETASYLMFPILILINIKSGMQRSVTLNSPTLQTQPLAPASPQPAWSLYIEKETSVGHPFKNAPFVCSCFSLFLFALPVPEKFKTAELPYFLAATFKYMTNLTTSGLCFCVGMLFYAQKIRNSVGTVKKALKVIVSSIIIELYKQLVQPIIIHKMMEAFGYQVEKQYFSSASGYSYLFLEVENMGIYSVLGLIQMWAWQWIR
ncbi:Hypothetical_protein [Hexamita inflata]|uniref:Hypothetical_protein n=1 Tax=Hexamita inflata TaxID=28002 RepID=A0AA86P472_9EUKA|nr:Hypothetical protein HINF_LOCUS18113 [Hexamita inflata]